jgi:anti-sigma regulatory factor (Ser/Thr protein kinase)
MERVFHYRSQIQEIPVIRENMADLADSWALPESEERQIVVIVEELFSNIIRFAFNDQREHLIEIRMKRSEDKICIVMIDDGIPFNPLEYHPGPIFDPATPNAGGMGLTLIQTFSDSIEYYRIDHKNHLEITKKIKSQPCGKDRKP